MEFGFELECGVRKPTLLRSTARKLGYNCGTDGSVDTEESEAVELRSRVYRVNQNQIKTMLEDFKMLSSFVKEINDSMGLHFHVSFSNLKDYQLLCSYGFVKFFQNAYKRRFKTRIEHDRITNDYCEFYKNKTAFNEELENGFGDGKYFSVNFGAYNNHGTIEFRIFPATRSLRKFKTYQNFLKKLIKKYLKEHKHNTINKNVKEIFTKRVLNEDDEEEDEEY